MPSANQLPGVRNGEPCPGCHTPIWGAQPKRCIICGYDFEHPDPSQTLAARAEAELGRTNKLAEALSSEMDRQREIEKSATARIESMVNDFLKMEWPEHGEGNTSPWKEAFTDAARQFWPEATFYNVEIEVFRDSVKDRWHKRISGSMDLTAQKVVGFRFDYGLIRNEGEAL